MVNTPLESALAMWIRMGYRKDARFEDIHDLLRIQAVAICLEKRGFREAETVFRRVFGENDTNRPLKKILFRIVSKKDPNHTFFNYFSYDCLIRKVKAFVHHVISEKSSSFLIKKATKIVKNTPVENEIVRESEENNNHIIIEESAESPKFVVRSDMNFFSLTQMKRRKSKQKVLDDTGREMGPQRKKAKQKCKNIVIDVVETTKDDYEDGNEASTSERPPGKKRRTWTWEEDMKLRSGVKKYGEGQWKKILSRYAFHDRTNVMLKDRWRTIKKAEVLSSESED
uniref:Telomeric repeat-binding factor n=1 Tax=Vombatus ursinus TaxID=29139 RepID=A0A4X2K1L7_VOMUR